MVEASNYGFMEKAHEQMDNERSKANPCLYYGLSHNYLTVWLSLIDDNVMLVNKKKVTEIQQKNEVEMNKHVGCKVEHNWAVRSLTMMQPVLI